MSTANPDDSELPVTPPRRFRLFSRSKSKIKGRFKGTALLSFLLCCPFGQKECKHTTNTGRRGSSNVVTTSHTATYSTTSAHTKEEESIEKKATTTPSPDISAPTTPAPDSDQDRWLLRPISDQDQGRKCLVLDLDETLVHSSFKVAPGADFVVPVLIDGNHHNVHVLKRPGVDAFMKRMGEIYEIVVFTASLSMYANPVLDKFDLHKVVRHRLFRESCFNHMGNYVKDLSQLGREENNIIILDNSPVSYMFHPANAVPVSTWFNDPHDSELIDLIPFLEDLAKVEDVTHVLDNTIPGPFSFSHL